MFIFDWLRERRTKKQRKREGGLCSHWAYVREKVGEEVAIAERHAAEGPLEPYPSRGSLDDVDLNQRVQDDEKSKELYHNYVMADKDKAPQDIVKLRKRLWSLRMTTRRREIWDSICQSRFYREHH